MLIRNKKKGVTILEIVIALAIIGIMLIPLGNALVTSVRTNKMGEIRQESKLISQEIIEKVRSIGDVKDSTFKVGKNKADEIKITQDPINTSLFGVEGTLTNSDGNIIVNGTIEGKRNFNEEHGSLKYLNKEFGLFILIQNGDLDESGNPKNNKISYWTSDKVSAGDPKTIDNYLKSTTGTPITIDDCKNLKIEIGGDTNKQKLIVNGVDLGSISSPGDGSVANIGVYVEGQRADDKLVDLYVNNKNMNDRDKVSMYFFNNKFHGIDYDPATMDKTDSFKYDRYLNGSISIYDNIIYYPVDKRLNKGLYTIDLNFTKKVPTGTDVVEKTRSEFMVDN